MEKTPQIKRVFLNIFIIYVGILLMSSFFAFPEIYTEGYYDKIEHFIVFIPVGYFSLLLLKKLRFLIPLFIAFIFEFIQLFIPYRTFSFIDMLSNFLGTFTGFLTFYAVKKLSKIVSVKFLNTI